MKSTYAQKNEVNPCVTSRNVACVDDRRAVPVAQRVLQRESGAVQRVKKEGGNDILEEDDPAYNTFIFQQYEDDENFRVLYDAGGKIYFTPYNNGEIKSAGFTGCFMMAFKFNENVVSSNLIENNSSNPLNLDAFYIAHVPNKSRQALFQAEQLNIIDIKALIRPFRGQDIDANHVNGTRLSEENKASEGRAAIHALTGGLQKNDDDEWFGNVYYQEKIYEENPYEKKDAKFTWNNTVYRSLATQDVDRETLMCKAFIYATVADKSEKLLGVDASEKLEKLATQNPEILDAAKETFGNRFAGIGSEDDRAFSNLESYLPFLYKAKRFIGWV